METPLSDEDETRTFSEVKAEKVSPGGLRPRTRSGKISGDRQQTRRAWGVRGACPERAEGREQHVRGVWKGVSRARGRVCTCGRGAPEQPAVD